MSKIARREILWLMISTIYRPESSSRQGDRLSPGAVAQTDQLTKYATDLYSPLACITRQICSSPGRFDVQCKLRDAKAMSRPTKSTVSRACLGGNSRCTRYLLNILYGTKRVSPLSSWQVFRGGYCGGPVAALWLHTSAYHVSHEEARRLASIPPKGGKRAMAYEAVPIAHGYLTA